MNSRRTVPTVAGANISGSALHGAVKQAQFSVARGDVPCRFETGARMAYAVETETAVDIDMSRATAQAQTGAARVGSSKPTSYHRARRWQIELVALEHDAEDPNLLAARIEDRGVVVHAGDELVDPIPAAALAETFLIRVDSRCEVIEFGWREEAALEPTRAQQLLVSGLGFVAPEQTGDATRYVASSFDGMGRYAATYRYEQGQLRGELSDYGLGASASASVGVSLGVDVLASNIEIELGVGAWFETLDSERDIELFVGAQALGTHFRAVRAERVDAGEFDPHVDLSDGGWKFGRLAAPERDPSEDFDPKLRELPVDDALTRYRELVADGRVTEYGRLLRDWLRANPEQTGAVLARLRDGEFDGEQVARSGVFYALGSANTAEAKAALTDILRDWPSVSQQISAAHALTMVQRPSADMLELVSAATQQVGLHPVERSSMALALGGLASEKHDNVELAAAAREQIGDWLAQPSSDDQVSHGLLAVGNAAHDGLAPALDPYFDHDDPQIRKQATQAVRGMSPEQAFPRLERALEDEDERVRTSALEIAASVARRHDRQPGAELVELAHRSLDAPSTEGRAAIALLGQAAQHGDARAGELLRERLEQQLHSDARDPAMLAALGRSAPAQWRAP